MTLRYWFARIWILIRSTISDFALLDIKNREQRRDDNEKSVLGKVSPGADTLSKSKRRRQDWIITQTSIRVEEPFWFEGIRFWIQDWVM